jgi:hypothetical protein
MKGGGIMSLGGAEPKIQKEPMTFVPLAKPGGWYTVRLLDLRMGGANDADASGSESIGVSQATYNTGKGVIVDSGTTDTYLPRKLAADFKRKWKKLAGRDYGNVKMTLTEREVARFPTLHFVFRDTSDKEVVVHMEPKSYLEHQGSNK